MGRAGLLSCRHGCVPSGTGGSAPGASPRAHPRCHRPRSWVATTLRVASAAAARDRALTARTKRRVGGGDRCESDRCGSRSGNQQPQRLGQLSGLVRLVVVSGYVTPLALAGFRCRLRAPTTSRNPEQFTQPTHRMQSVHPRQPTQPRQRVQARQPRHARQPRVAAHSKVNRLPATPRLPAVAIEPATPRLPAVAIEPATPRLPAVAAEPATRVLSAMGADTATADRLGSRRHVSMVIGTACQHSRAGTLSCEYSRTPSPSRLPQR